MEGDRLVGVLPLREGGKVETMIGNDGMTQGTGIETQSVGGVLLSAARDDVESIKRSTRSCCLPVVFAFLIFVLYIHTDESILLLNVLIDKLTYSCVCLRKALGYTFHLETCLSALGTPYAFILIMSAWSVRNGGCVYNHPIIF